MPGKGQLQTRPSPVFEGLPDELSEFLSRDTYSLLIKGDSGTGKTILALTILRSLLPLENPLYLSTRTSPLQLVENYPWVEEIFGPANAAESGKEGEGWETLVDARLDEPNVIFERITNVLMDKQAPTVVIDSWESLSDALGSEALRTNIKVLQTWRERAGARFIFVGEDPGNTAIDYMVEGVVVLKDRVEEGRRLREIVLSKLHGVQISKPSYLFTLQGGAFASFPAYAPGDYEFRSPIPVRFEAPPRRRGKSPTGYGPLDAHLGGGLPLKSTAVVEVDQRVDTKAALVFLSRAVQDWLAAGGRAVIERPDGVEKRYLTQYVRAFSGDGPIEIGDRPRTEERGGRAKARKTLAVVQGQGTGQTPEGAVPEAELVIRIVRERESGGAAERAKSLMKLLLIGGTLFVQCELPTPALFGVIPGMSGGDPTMRLEQVV